MAGPEWINVEERLPEESEFGCSKEILIWAQNTQGHYHYEIGYYCHDDKLWRFPCASSRMKPLYWMPLRPPNSVVEVIRAERI